MPAALLSRDEVIERLMLVFRKFGYDGASLTELSQATGLGKSSLYHYFPEGKDDMVRAVLDHLHQTLEDVLFVPLRTHGPARARVEQMVETLNEFYSGGRESCVLGNLVLGTSLQKFRAKLTVIFDAWIDALAAALIDSGVSRKVARARAEDGVMQIEGALILAHAMGDNALFDRALHQLPKALLLRDK